MLPTPLTMLKALYSSLFILFGPLQMSPTYLQHFYKYLRKLVGRTLGAPVLVHSSY